MIDTNRINADSIITIIEIMTLRVQAHPAATLKPTPIVVLTIPSTIIMTFSNVGEENADNPWLMNQKPAIKLKKPIILTPEGAFSGLDLNI